jgi:hypothetical protein
MWQRRSPSTAQIAIYDVLNIIVSHTYTSVVALLNSSLVSAAAATMQAAGPAFLLATAVVTFQKDNAADSFGLMCQWQYQSLRPPQGACLSFHVPTWPLCKLQLQLRLALVFKSKTSPTECSWLARRHPAAAAAAAGAAGFSTNQLAFKPIAAKAAVKQLPTLIVM